MVIIKQYLVILSCLLIGELISYGLNLTVPGNVVGMVILTIALVSGIIKLETVEKAADQLIKNLILFFIPLTVGVVAHKDILKEYFLPITVSTIVSIFLVLIVTGYVAQILTEKRRETQKEGKDIKE
ncbi:MAG: CidA/LrgA family protein [Mahellales bacterium]